jgi:hypothetical protein
MVAKHLVRLADRFCDGKLAVALTSISADSKADIVSSYLCALCSKLLATIECSCKMSKKFLNKCEIQVH